MTQKPSAIIGSVDPKRTDCEPVLKNLAVDVKATRVFISYSHANEIWMTERLAGNKENPQYLLGRWKREYPEPKFLFWFDREKGAGIRGGDQWRERIFAEIDVADVAILLITDDFVISQFIREEELPRIVSRFQKGELEILPVYVEEAQLNRLVIPDAIHITPGKPTPLGYSFEASIHHEYRKALIEISEAMCRVMSRAKEKKCRRTGQRPAETSDNPSPFSGPEKPRKPKFKLLLLFCALSAVAVISVRIFVYPAVHNQGGDAQHLKFSPTHEPKPNHPLPPKVNEGTAIEDMQEVSGTWEKAYSPFIVKGEAIVPKDKTLTIKPGVIVRFQSQLVMGVGKIGFMRIYGRLDASGTKSENILFTKNEGGNNTSWGSIIFDKTAECNLLRYCKFEYSRGVQDALRHPNLKAWETGVSGAVFLYRSNATIENCTFRSNTYGAIKCYDSSPKINDNMMLNIASINFVAITCVATSSPTISNNTIYCENGRDILRSPDSSPIVYNMIIFVRGQSVQMDENVVNEKVPPEPFVVLRNQLLCPGIAYSLVNIQTEVMRLYIGAGFRKITELSGKELYDKSEHCIYNVDPQFVDEMEYDLHLRPTSPCLGKGKSGADMGMN